MKCAGRFGFGWAHDVFKFAYHMFMHFSCIRTFIYLYFDIDLCWCFFACLSLSWLVALWHLNENPLHPRTLFVLGHLPLILPPPMSNSMMRRPSRTSRRTFHDATFIQNAKSFYRIFPILNFPLSSTVEVRSHCVASRSLVPLWSYKSFTPTFTDSVL